MSDLIDREAVREFIKSYGHSTDVVYHMEKHLYEVPTINAVPVVHGEWIYHNYENGNWYCTCSNCGKGDLHAIKGTVPYCWNCGARMDGGEHDLR